MEAQRLPRFRRAGQVSEIELTDRDRQILTEVHRHRFLRSSHIIDLVDGSAQQILRRLQLLYHHGFLDRPRTQIDYYHRGGSRRIVYGLGKKGFTLLKRELNLPTHLLSWCRTNSATSRLFLEHALLTSDFMVRMELSCRDNLWLKLVPDDAVKLPEMTGKTTQHFHWKVKPKRGPTLGVVPDAVFALERLHAIDRKKNTLYFLEADRGTMPITRKGFEQSSFFRKLVAYQQSWEQGLLTKRFGKGRFRVLTVTSTPERRDHLRDACRKLGTGKGLFLFADRKSMEVTHNLLLLPWLNADGGVETLF